MSTEQQEIVAVAAAVQADTCCTCNMFNQEPAYLCFYKKKTASMNMQGVPVDMDRAARLSAVMQDGVL